MWKFNKFSVIFSALFLSVLVCFTPLIQLKANAVESYRISPEEDREFRRGVYYRTSIPDNKNIDIHYYFYASNNFAEDLNLIVYSCDYLHYNESGQYEVLKKSGCGLYMVNEGGYFKIKLISSVYSISTYSRRTNSVKQSSGFNYPYTDDKNEIARFTDEDFRNGLTLLGGTTLKENSWNREEGGFLLNPIGGNSSPSSGNNNNNSGGLNIDFGGFVKGIVDGIANFFGGMVENVKKAPENIGRVTSGIFNGAIESINKIWNFFDKFFENMMKFFESIMKKIEEFFKWLFVPDSEVIGVQIDSFSNHIKTQSGSIGKIFAFSSSFGSQVGDGGCRISGNFLPAQFSQFSELNICAAFPTALILIARPLLIIAIIWMTIHRIVRFISILLGTHYMWEKEGHE